MTAPHDDGAAVGRWTDATRDKVPMLALFDAGPSLGIRCGVTAQPDAGRSPYGYSWWLVAFDEDGGDWAELARGECATERDAKRDVEAAAVGIATSILRAVGVPA